MANQSDGSEATNPPAAYPPRCLLWVRSDGRGGHRRLLLFDPKAVVQGRASILQEARLVSRYPKCAAQDIYPSKSWANDALLQPESRAAFQRLLDQGWIDAIRTLHPGEPMYTFWDYKRDRWRRNTGLRLDHLLLSPPLVDRLTEAGVDSDVRGKEGASDHAPAWIVLCR